MKQSEQIIRESKDKLQYLFNRLYLYEDEGAQRAFSAEIVKQVELINNAQRVVDKSRTFCDDAFKELVDFTVAWNEKYIPLYKQLISVYYAELETYQKQMFNTSWKDLDAIERIRSQYRNIQAKTSSQYYVVKGGYDIGDYYCIRDFVIGRTEENAIDYMIRALNTQGIQKVNKIMGQIHKYIGPVVAYNIAEDTDGISGIVAGEGGRVEIKTKISSGRVHAYIFNIKRI